MDGSVEESDAGPQGVPSSVTVAIVQLPCAARPETSVRESVRTRMDRMGVGRVHMLAGFNGNGQWARNAG
jgi:hypothetical protein